MIALVPGHLGFKGERAAAQVAHTLMLAELNQPYEAVASLSQARKSVDELLRVDPANIIFRQTGKDLHHASGRVNERLGRITDAMRDYESELRASG